MSAPLHIEIGELAIHGCDPAEGAEIGGVLARELQRLFERHTASGRALDARRFESIDAGEIELREGASAREIGMETARAVFGVVTR